MILKYIGAFICCLPLWILLIDLWSTAVDRMCTLVEDASDSVLYQFFIQPLLGVIIAFVVPMVFLGLGVLVWVLAELLFGLGPI